MSMPNWLIPTGELLFSGNETQLRSAVGALNGTMGEDHSFTCRLGGGAASFRFKMETRFRCAFEKAPGGIRITWQAWPALTVWLLFGALAAVALLGLVSWKLELAGWTACLLGLLVFLYAIQRGTCVEQFTQTFSPSEQTKGAS